MNGKISEELKEYETDFSLTVHKNATNKGLFSFFKE